MNNKKRRTRASAFFLCLKSRRIVSGSFSAAESAGMGIQNSRRCNICHNNYTIDRLIRKAKQAFCAYRMPGQNAWTKCPSATGDLSIRQRSHHRKAGHCAAGRMAEQQPIGRPDTSTSGSSPPDQEQLLDEAEPDPMLQPIRRAAAARRKQIPPP